MHYNGYGYMKSSLTTTDATTHRPYIGYFLYSVLGAVRKITDKLDLKNERKKLKNREEIYVFILRNKEKISR